MDEQRKKRLIPNTARAAQRCLKDPAVPEAREVQDLVLAAEK